MMTSRDRLKNEDQTAVTLADRTTRDQGVGDEDKKREPMCNRFQEKRRKQMLRKDRKPNGQYK